MTMPHLFTPEGEAALARTLREQPLLAFDFDGTLTPIVARPGDVRLSAGVSGRLALLATQLPVAIVTGRSVDDVRGRLGFQPRYIVGNHGAEDAEDAQDLANQGPASTALRELHERLLGMQPQLAAAGVTLEDKGHSLALHFRLSRTRDRAKVVIAEALADLDASLRVFGGKQVVNVVEAHAPDKAAAVRALMRRCGARVALFAGDDVNDEPVFASAPDEWLTVRVGREDPRSRAHFFLDSQGEMTLLLERMVNLLGVR